MEVVLDQEQRKLGMYAPASMSQPQNQIGQGIADDVDNALPAFLEHEIRLERSWVQY